MGRKLGGRAVEDDAAADQDHALDEPLDGAELVRDVENRDAESLVQLAEKGAEGLLRVEASGHERPCIARPHVELVGRSRFQLPSRWSVVVR